MKVQPIDLTEHPTTCDTCKKRITEGFKVAAETDKETAKIMDSIIKNYVAFTRGRPTIIVCNKCVQAFAHKADITRN